MTLWGVHYATVGCSGIIYEAEASISIRILGPDPTTSEAYRVYPIVDPTKFWEGVGNAHGCGDNDAKIVTTSGHFPT